MKFGPIVQCTLRPPGLASLGAGGPDQGASGRSGQNPDLELTPVPDWTGRLFEVLRGTRHRLLLFEGSEERTADAPQQIEAVVDWVRGRHAGRIVPHRILCPGAELGPVSHGRVTALRDLDSRLHRGFDARVACLNLLRPDGYVGYRSRPPDARRFGTYLERLFLMNPSAESATMTANRDNEPLLRRIDAVLARIVADSVTRPGWYEAWSRLGSAACGQA